jgi:hypothetical protein
MWLFLKSGKLMILMDSGYWILVAGRMIPLSFFLPESRIQFLDPSLPPTFIKSFMLNIFQQFGIKRM